MFLLVTGDEVGKKKISEEVSNHNEETAPQGKDQDPRDMSVYGNGIDWNIALHKIGII